MQPGRLALRGWAAQENEADEDADDFEGKIGFVAVGAFADVGEGFVEGGLAERDGPRGGVGVRGGHKGKIAHLRAQFVLDVESLLKVPAGVAGEKEGDGEEQKSGDAGSQG